MMGNVAFFISIMGWFVALSAIYSARISCNESDMALSKCEHLRIEILRLEIKLSSLEAGQ